MPKPPSEALYKPLSELRMWEANYNQGDIGAIAQAISAFGFRGALRVWKDDMVIAGNHTLMALMSLKAQGPLPEDKRPPSINYKWPPVGVIEQDGDWYIKYIDCSDFNEVEAKAFAIADNEIARKATRDEAALAQLLIEIYQYDKLIGEATGLDAEGLDELIVDLSSTPPSIPDDFKEYGEDIDVDYKCPKCGYAWSGKTNGEASVQNT